MAFQEMRTKGREVVDPVEIKKILSANQILRIGFYDEDVCYPYIVPLNYGFEYDLVSGKLTFYCHSAKKGRKLEIMKKNNRVCFEIDESWGLKQTAYACEWALNFNSIIGVGRIYEIPDEDTEAKKRGLDIIMNNHGRYHALDYNPVSFSHTTVLKLEAEHFTGKRYRDRTGEAEAARQEALGNSNYNAY